MRYGWINLDFFKRFGLDYVFVLHRMLICLGFLRESWRLTNMTTRLLR